MNHGCRPPLPPDVMQKLREKHDGKSANMQDICSTTNKTSLTEIFADLSTFCMFIGFPRSGHSLVAALLDAHSNIVIAHEVHALKKIYEGFSETQIYSELVENSIARAKNGRGTKRYSYTVADQWQGKFHKLRVIGDKQGGGTTSFLAKHSDALHRLKETIALKVKFICVLRNPFDNISTIAARSNLTLEQSSHRYFSLCSLIEEIKRQISTDDLIDLTHESFIQDPVRGLKGLCDFLEEPVTEDYLIACGSIVYKSPHKSRNDFEWSQKLIAATENRIAEFAFLNGYSFEN